MKRLGLRSMAGVVSVSLWLGLLPTPASAVGRGKARYLGGTLAGLQAKVEAPIDLTGTESLVFMPQGAPIQIRWTSVAAVSDRARGIEADERTLLGAAFWPSLFFTKGRTHHVTPSPREAVPPAPEPPTGRAGAPVASVPAAGAPGPRPPVGGGARRAAPSADCARVAPGQRVRLRSLAESAEPLVGQVTASDGTTITVLLNRGQKPWELHDTWEVRAVPRAWLASVEVSERRSKKPLGALIGGLVGVAAGVGIAAGAGAFDEDRSTGQGYGMLIGLAGAAGAGLGRAIAPGDRWVAAPPGPGCEQATACATRPSRLRVGVGHVHGGAGMSLTVGF